MINVQTFRSCLEPRNPGSSTYPFIDFVTASLIEASASAVDDISEIGRFCSKANDFAGEEATEAASDEVGVVGLRFLGCFAGLESAELSSLFEVG